MTGIAANQPEKKENTKPIYKFFLKLPHQSIILFTVPNMNLHLLLTSNCPMSCSYMGLPHSLIKQTALKQFFLGSFRFYIAIFQNHNLVCLCEGRQSVQR